MKLKCVESDKEIILGMRRRLGSNHKVSRAKERLRKDGWIDAPSVSVQIVSLQLYKSLLVHGLVPCKSEIDLEFREVPNELMGHFSRGYLDGDGSLGIYVRGPCISFYGGKKFLEKLLRFVLMVLDVRDCGVKCGGRIFNLRWRP